MWLRHYRFYGIHVIATWKESCIQWCCFSFCNVLLCNCCSIVFWCFSVIAAQRLFIIHYFFLFIYFCSSICCRVKKGQGESWKGYKYIFTFFYISRRKYWFRASFQFPVFDECTCFGMSWTRLNYFWKMSVCLCVCVCVTKKFVTSIARELMNWISWNFTFSITSR